MLQRIRNTVEELLSDPPRGNGKTAEAVIMALILMVCALLVARAYTTAPGTTKILWIIETVITSIFLVEYLLRMWIAEKKLRHLVNPYSVIDLIAVLPLVLPGTYFFQVIRIFRILRILRLVRYLRDPFFFFGTISRKTLVVIRIVFTVSAIIFVASGLIYYAEHEANPRVFSSFGDAVYFSIVTMATVGFGDITPVTTYGRWVTVLIIFSGIVLLPWQIKDLIEQIVLGYTKVPIRCPTCSLEPHDPDAKYCRRCGTELPPPGRKGQGSESPTGPAPDQTQH